MPYRRSETVSRRSWDIPSPPAAARTSTSRSLTCCCTHFCPPHSHFCSFLLVLAARTHARTHAVGREPAASSLFSAAVSSRLTLLHPPLHLRCASSLPFRAGKQRFSPELASSPPTHDLISSSPRCWPPSFARPTEPLESPRSVAHRTPSARRPLRVGTPRHPPRPARRARGSPLVPPMEAR